MEQVMLDMIPTGAKAVCHVSQYDIGRTIRFNLRSGGAVYTLSGTETVKVYIKKPDGTTAERNIANTSSTYVDWVTGEGDCDQAGGCECELVITSGTTVIGSKNFTVKIEEDPYNDQGVVTETAGPAIIATFTTNVVDLLQEVKCEINAKQDLHGYDHPWPAGGGKNKLNAPNPITINTGATVDTLVGTVNVTSGETYTVSCNQQNAMTSNERNTLIVVINGNRIYESSNSNYHLSSGLHTLTFTATASGECEVRLWGHTLSTATTYDKFQFEVGSQATAYEPYENICPISGFTEMDIIRAGVNLIDISDLATTGITYSSGDLSGSANDFNTAYDNGYDDGLKFKANTRYTISMKARTEGNASTSGNGLRVGFIYTDNSKDNVAITNSTTTQTAVSFTSATGKTVKAIYFTYGSASANIWHISDLQLEEGSTASAYHPAEIIEKNIQLGQTVYRARINITTGQGIIDMAGVTDLSQLDWTKYDVGGNNLYRSEELNIKKTGTQYDLPDLLCSAYPVVRQAERKNMTMSMPTNSNHVDIINNNYSNVSDFKASLAGKQMAYEMATPVTIQLTPEQIEALLGVNNVWHDGNGNTEVKYLYNA